MTTEERLEKVEQELKETKAGLTATKRRNRWMLGGVALLILGCLTIAATTRDKRTIRANEFILEDENGVTRATLEICKDAPKLSMTDENGKTSAVLGVTPTGPMLVLLGESGKTKAVLGVTHAGPVQGVTPAGPGLVLFDESGKTRAVLGMGLAEDGRTGTVLALSDANGKVRAMMGETPDGPELYMKDTNGKPIWKAQ